VAYNVNLLPKFRDNISITFSKVKKPKKSFLFRYLDTLNGSERLSRNVDNVIPLCAPKYQIVAGILLHFHRKPDIMHFSSLSVAISFIVRKFNCCSMYTCTVVFKRGAYVAVRAQLRTWLVTTCYVLNVVVRKLRSGTARLVFGIW
jgi:hypothetical protein